MSWPHLDLLVRTILVGGDHREEHERYAFRNADGMLDAAFRQHELAWADLPLRLITDREQRPPAYDLEGLLGAWMHVGHRGVAGRPMEQHDP